MKTYKRWCLLVLAVLLALPCVSVGEGELSTDSGLGDEIAAEDLSSFIRFDTFYQKKISEAILNGSLSKPISFAPYEHLPVWWEENVKGHWLCVQWNCIPEGVHMMQFDQNDALLLDTCVPEEFDMALELEAGTKKVTIAADRQGMEIAQISLYSKGQLPEPYMPWKPLPGHLDYLVISTHPDDDVIFMGGVVPIYGMERGYVGTIAYVTIPSRYRVNEALLGAWTMGARYRPVFLGFRDLNNNHTKDCANMFLPDAVTRSIVRLFRQQRPLVVFSHDVNGEYGHWQHVIVSAAVVEACKLAADERYDPETVTEYGTWEVKKCYLHLYPENTLVMDVNVPLASMGEKTAIQIDMEAFIKHRTQQNGRHWVQTDWDVHPLSKFGMAYGTVEAGKDVFDNIDPKLFVRFLEQLQVEEPPAA